MLYLVATPIGNLKDISFRAIEVLSTCDYILCEDTRHSRVLLQHYEINKPLKSFHKFNELSKEKEIIDDLLTGKIIALITDAGTPGISDPGSKLVQACRNYPIKISAIPGPCAAIVALSCSGLNTERFQFWGFLPRKSHELQRILKEILMYPFTTICYESPQRLLKVLEALHELAPIRLLTIARELTKKFEEYVHGNASELLDYWKKHPLKGEIVLVISGNSDQKKEWEQLSPLQHVELLERTYFLSRAEAIKMVAELRGVPKRKIYNEIHQ